MRTVGEREVETVGMAVAPARLAVVERDVRRAPLATQHANALCRQEVRSQGWATSRRKFRARTQEGSPRQVAAIQPRGWSVALDVRGGRRATRRNARHGGIVEARQHADEPLVITAGKSELARLRSVAAVR